MENKPSINYTLIGGCVFAGIGALKIITMFPTLVPIAGSLSILSSVICLIYIVVFRCMKKSVVKPVISLAASLAVFVVMLIVTPVSTTTVSTPPQNTVAPGSTASVLPRSKTPMPTPAPVSSEAPPSVAPATTNGENIESVEKPANIEEIEVKIDVQGVVDKKQKVVVWMKNTTDKKFTGYLYVWGENAHGKRIGDDMALVDNLEAGKSSYAIMWFKPSDAPKFQYSWGKDYKFE